MKARLNLTIDNNLLENIKSYALKQQTSVSELVENYFKAVIKPAKRENVIDMIEKLDKPLIKEGVDLKDLYYQDKSKKNGF
jgi:hypothetical protein